MYSNLSGLLNSKRIPNAAVASLLGVHPNTVSAKLRGESDFDVQEALKIANTYFPEYNLNYLFAQTEDGNGRRASHKTA